MVRTSLCVNARLMRAQAVRQKREAIEGAATQDAWTLHVAEQSMLKVADPEYRRVLQLAVHVHEPQRRPVLRGEQAHFRGWRFHRQQRVRFRPLAGLLCRSGGDGVYIERLEAARPKAAPVAAPAPHMDQRIEENVSEDSTNSHDVAFETWMSVQPWNQGPGRPDETDLRERLREALAESRLPGRELPAPGRESPGRAG